MIEETYTGLKLNKNNRLRQRLAASEIVPNIENLDISCIYSKEAATSLPHLSDRSKQALKNIRFREARILGDPPVECYWLHNG